MRKDKMYVNREDVVAIIERQQKELCPYGLYGRSYAKDRDTWDAWQEIIDEINRLEGFSKNTPPL